MARTKLRVLIFLMWERKRRHCPGNCYLFFKLTLYEAGSNATAPFDAKSCVPQCNSPLFGVAPATFTPVLPAVPELAFRDGIMDRIRLHEQRFDERAYLFVLAALEFCQQRLPERRHISGRELALSCRDLALERFGVLARVVLEHWGVKSSSDIGDIVFTLVELEMLMSQSTDTRDEFVGVFDFDQAFERDYPWCAQFV